ncbi:undecaprenyl-diphosphatase [Bradyrhizobium arachidis]|nr:undecaprenyl-diphosphatase [Bradyrhizobium arachidis]
MALVTVRPRKQMCGSRGRSLATPIIEQRSSRVGLRGEPTRRFSWPLAAAGWLATRTQGEALRRVGNHALLVAVAASLLPHGMKSLFDQTRPDRRTVLGHVHGISFSGKREDAFPSGHALHMGALASAVGPLPPGPRRAIRALAIGLSLTRVAVLAHWASDVVAGFALGALLE